MTAENQSYRCTTCDRVFPDEPAIRAHQDLYQAMHRIDPEVNEHDGAPWGTAVRHVLPELNSSPDLVADMAAELCDAVFADPSLLDKVRSSIRRLVLDRLTDDPARAYEFNRRMREHSKLVATFAVEIDVPRVVSEHRLHSDLEVPIVAFNKAWGYADGLVNREPAYEGEPAEYGLGRGSLVPIKWPEPDGLQDATRLLHAGQKQTVTVEVYSDGRRRVVPATSRGA